MDTSGRPRDQRVVQQILPGIDRARRRPTPIVQKARPAAYDDLPDILTPKEARAFLRIGRNAVYAALQDGRIRSARFGQKFLIPKIALRDFLDRSSEPVSTGTPVKGKA